jgi:hypothetical protein
MTNHGYGSPQDDFENQTPNASDSSSEKQELGAEDGSLEDADPDATKGVEDVARVDFSGVMPRMDFTSFMPKLDVADFMPKLDVADFMPKLDVADFMPKLDVADFMPKLQLNLPIPDLSATFAGIFKKLHDSQPPNWPVDIDIDRVVEVVQNDGLPLVWVPRAEVVVKVMAAHDRTSRIDVLLDHFDEVTSDCANVLADVDHANLSGPLDLARRSIAALSSGHHEAAQALAVVTTETAVVEALGNGGGTGQYNVVKDRVGFDPASVAYSRVRLEAALAPIRVFFTSWWKNSGAPMPDALSRHVSVHQADPAHYTRSNALIAGMLVASVLRALQEHYELSDRQAGS